MPPPHAAAASTPLFELRCPTCQAPLTLQADAYACASQHTFPIVRGIPRFVAHEGYTDSFGLQWNTYRTAQLDSHTGQPISRERLTRLFGGDLRRVKGQKVLEAGCGAGRFTEILLAEGAHLFSADLSSAVEASRANIGNRENYFLGQANILTLPVAPEQFDFVVCVGVLQHTPDPQETIRRLVGYLKPGGTLVIDHYGPDYPATPSRRAIRAWLRHLPPRVALSVSNGIVRSLWPLHRAFWKYKYAPVLRNLRPHFIELSPVVDYHAAHWEIGKENLLTWALLDTHDTLTDYFKHLMSKEQTEKHLYALGMTQVTVRGLGTPEEPQIIVEAMAVKPAKTAD